MYRRKPVASRDKHACTEVRCIVLTGSTEDQPQIISGSSGDDEMHAGADDEVEGGDGFDTLVFDGSRSGSVVRNIEAFSSEDGVGDDQLTLTEAEVLSFTDGNNVLRIEGAAGDALRRGADDHWQRGETLGGFTTYTSNLASLEWKCSPGSMCAFQTEA